MDATSYDKWDRAAAAARALQHADASDARDAGGGIWNFAFGSNMSASKVRSRGITPIRSQLARLPGWSLLFNHKGGYGNIESACCIHEQKIDVSHMPQPMPQATHGLSPSDFAELARQEYAYHTIQVATETTLSDGSTRIHHALAFKTAPCALVSSRTLPSPRYMRIICDGAREAGVDAAYCAWLQQLPTERS